MFYGYHRVSTSEQKLDRGVVGIESFCKKRGYKLEKVFVDKMTGKTLARPRYTVLKEDVLRSGDTLIIYELDRLSRTKKDICEELRYFEEKGIRVMILDIPTTTIELPDEADTMNRLITETINKVIIEIYAMQAQTEMERRKKRQSEGIQSMKERGDWSLYGKPRLMSLHEFKMKYRKVEKGELKPVELMKQLKMKKSTFYKYVNELRSCPK